MSNRNKGMDWVKRVIHQWFALFGLRISRIAAPDSIESADSTAAEQPRGGCKYFNTGKLSPREENSIELYDRFYSDHQALDEYYDDHRLGFYAEVSRFIRSRGLSLDGKEVIDVGCGTGHLLTELTRWAAPQSLTGCDFSLASIAYSRLRFPSCRFFTHDIYQPLVGDYDVVICTEVLEHLEWPYIAINNLFNATRLGGHLIVTVPDGRKDVSNEHINFWSPESWKSFIERECNTGNVVFGLIHAGKINIAVISR